MLVWSQRNGGGAPVDDLINEYLEQMKRKDKVDGELVHGAYVEACVLDVGGSRWAKISRAVGRKDGKLWPKDIELMVYLLTVGRLRAQINTVAAVNSNVAVMGEE